ncbi:MAG: ribonuclease Z [Leeuwenhoekiella sp.]
MQVDKKEEFTILGDDEDNVSQFASFLEFIVPKAYKNDNLVIDLLKYKEMTLEELLSFLVLSNKQRASKKSFVLVNKSKNIELIPEEIMVVPTIDEAKDVIDLEEIQRDLGF